MGTSSSTGGAPSLELAERGLENPEGAGGLRSQDFESLKTGALLAWLAPVAEKALSGSNGPGKGAFMEEDSREAEAVRGTWGRI